MVDDFLHLNLLLEAEYLQLPPVLFAQLDFFFAPLLDLSQLHLVQLDGPFYLCLLLLCQLLQLLYLIEQPLFPILSIWAPEFVHQVSVLLLDVLFLAGEGVDLGFVLSDQSVHVVEQLLPVCLHHTPRLLPLALQPKPVVDPVQFLHLPLQPGHSLLLPLIGPSPVDSLAPTVSLRACLYPLAL